MTFKVPEDYRVTYGRLKSDSRYGNNGFFTVPYKDKNYYKRFLDVIASDGEGWEHVSVSMPDECPSWQQMCFIKNMFWAEEDIVIQIHPPKSEYVNCHQYCLHLWRKFGDNNFVDVPHHILVGPLGGPG